MVQPDNPYASPGPGAASSGMTPLSSLPAVGDETISVTYQSSLEDALARIVYQAIDLDPNVLRHARRRALIPIAGLLLGGYLIFKGLRLPMLWLAAFGITLVVFARIALSRWYQLYRLRRFYRRFIRAHPQEFIGENQLTLHPEGMTWTKPDYVMTRRWVCIEHIGLTRNYIFLAGRGLVWANIPPSALLSEENYLRFLALVRHYAPNAVVEDLRAKK